MATLGVLMLIGTVAYATQPTENPTNNAETANFELAEDLATANVDDSLDITVFIDKWTSETDVTAAETINAIHNGRVYTGLLQRQGQPTTVNGNDAAWGAIFTGTVTFTGLEQDFDTETAEPYTFFELDLE